MQDFEGSQKNGLADMGLSTSCRFGEPGGVLGDHHLELLVLQLIFLLNEYIYSLPLGVA